MAPWSPLSPAVCLAVGMALGTGTLMTLPAAAQEAAEDGEGPDGASEGEGEPDEDPSLREALEETRAAIAAQKEAIAAQAAELDALRQELAAQREEAELAALMSDAETVDETQSWTDRIRLYGFMDMGLQRVWGDSLATARVTTEATTFVFGNANIYLDAEPFEDWRVLTEVRLSLLPQGVEIDPGNPLRPERFDATVVDVTSPGAGLEEVRYGSVIIERAHIDWTPSDALTLRAGYFLTPYGIWNVDHGTPTLISLTLPGFIVAELWPTHQLGVEALGKTLLAPWELGYHAYVSNGRGTSQVDFTDDKAVGMRLVAKKSRGTKVQLGLSAYYGRNADVTKVLVGTSGFEVGLRKTEEHTEWGVATDISLDVGQLRLRAEALVHQVIWDEGERGQRFNFGPAADRTDVGAYVLLAYRLPHGFEPFLFADVLRWPQPVADLLVLPSVGMNIHFTPATLLKVQYSRVAFFYTEDTGGALEFPGTRYLNFVAARVVTAF